MKKGYDFDPMKSIHYIQVIDFINLMKLKIFKKSKFYIKLIMTLYIQFKEIISLIVRNHVIETNINWNKINTFKIKNYNL